MISAASQRAIDRTWRAVAPVSRRSASSRRRRSAIMISVLSTAIDVKTKIIATKTGAADQLRIEVSDNGRGAAGSHAHGHGLIGIHERVKLYDGEMATGTTNGGGFTLTARLPLTGYRS
jgi:glucose-6-phosphate-specific signal transduction histidine kinase